MGDLPGEKTINCSIVVDLLSTNAWSIEPGTRSRQLRTLMDFCKTRIATTKSRHYWRWVRSKNPEQVSENRREEWRGSTKIVLSSAPGDITLLVGHAASTIPREAGDKYDVQIIGVAHQHNNERSTTSLGNVKRIISQVRNNDF